MAVKSYALTTLARLKDFIGISVATYDTILETIIDVCTDIVEAETGRRFKQTSYSNEEYHGSGQNTLVLKNYPVVSGETFNLEKRGAVTREDNWNSIDSELYYVDEEAGIITMAGSGIFLKVPYHYRVTYTAGYNFDNAGGGSTLNDVGIGDLEIAFWKLCNNVYAGRKSQTGIKSESIGNYSVTFGELMSTDKWFENVINKYKRNPLIY